MIKIAIRNILANKRRSFFTLLSISAGGMGLLLALGFMMATFDGLATNFISDEGHLQIFNSEYFKNKDLLDGTSVRLRDYQDLINRIEKWEHVVVVTPRMEFSGIVGNEYQSLMMIGNAINPEKEVKIGSGGFFAPLVKGRFLSSSQEDGAYLGAGLAQKLHISVGDYVNLLANTIHGSYNSVSVKVQGILKYSITEYNDARVDVNIKLAQLLLDEPGVDRLVILLDDQKYIPEIKQKLTTFINENHLPIIVKDWIELSPYYVAVKNLYQRIFYFLLLLILVIMILSIVNNIMISVYERFREIGVMRAIGTTQQKVGQIFFLESFFLGVVGWITAVVFALGIKYLIEHMGIVMPPAPGRTYSYPLSFQFTSWYYLFVLLVCFASAIIGGIIPATKASKVKIIEALRYV